MNESQGTRRIKCADAPKEKPETKAEQTARIAKAAADFLVAYVTIGILLGAALWLTGTRHPLGSLITFQPGTNLLYSAPRK